MQPKKRLRLVSLLSISCILILFLTACAGESTQSTQKNLVAAPADKQILRFPLEGEDFSTLDPALTTEGLGDPFNLIYTGLVSIKGDGTITDQLAASHAVSADGLTYTFTLRPNLTFSDGTPLTARDVAYSINRTLLPATQSNVRVYLSLLKDFDKVTSGAIPTALGDSLIVKDDRTISITLSSGPSISLAHYLTPPPLWSRRNSLTNTATNGPIILTKVVGPDSSKCRAITIPKVLYWSPILAIMVPSPKSSRSSTLLQVIEIVTTRHSWL